MEEIVCFFKNLAGEYNSRTRNQQSQAQQTQQLLGDRRSVRLLFFGEREREREERI